MSREVARWYLCRLINQWHAFTRWLVATRYRAYLTGLAAGAVLALWTVAVIVAIVEAVR